MSIGKFIPVNDNGNKEFEVATKEECFESDRQAFKGVKENGQEYHVYTQWWTFVEHSVAQDS